MPFYIIRQDITKMAADAIVNAANVDLRMGGGVCGAIFRAAGAEEMQAACDAVSPIKTGGAAITPGFGLAAKYVVHTAGPVYNAAAPGLCEAQLYSAYRSSLELAEKNGCESIAFPLISAGIYGYPPEEALTVATRAIKEYLEAHDMEVYLCVFDPSGFAVSKKLMGSVESYIDEHYVETHTFRRRADMDESMPLRKMADFSAPMAPAAMPAPMMQKPAVGAGSIEEMMQNLDAPFADALFKLIDAKGMKDSDVYKRANIDRKLFSKIRTGKGYTPKKPTILALAIALELSLEETEGLLKRAGYALSHANKFDVIAEYFIITGQYDIFEINQVLFKYDLPLLGGQ